jgi:hypothetical protein
MAWMAAFRPKQGSGAGVPARLLKFVEEAPKRPAKISRKQNGGKDAIS